MVVADHRPLLGLWQQLTHQLRDIYDAHHVCVAAAQVTAAAWNTTVLIALRSPSTHYYDVWLCYPHERTEQMRWWDDETPLTALIEAGGPQWVQLPGFDDEPLLLTHFYRSAHGTAPLGAIALLEPKAIDNDSLVTLAELITTYLERALLRYRAMQQEITFDVVNDITLKLTSTLSLEDIFDKVSNPIRRVLNVESVSIGFYHADAHELVFVKELLGPLFVDLPELRLKTSQGIAGWVAEHGQPALVNDVYSDPRFFPAPDQVSGFQTNSILCVPLQVEQQVIGVLEAINKQVGYFDSSDLDLMQAIASPLAIALENANLHSEVLAEKRRIEATFKSMSEGMLTIDANRIVTGVNDSLLALLRVDSSSRLVGAPVNEVLQARRHDFGQFVNQVFDAESEVPNLACDVFVDYPSEAAPVLVSGASIIDEHGKHEEAIFVFSDLRQIREVERMRDDFFHNIVHELRTPLATILMYARLLKKGHANADKALRYIDVIERESDRLQTMVRQMLALAKLEARETQRSDSQVQVAKLLAEIMPPLSDIAVAKGLTFSANVADDMPPLIGDREVLYSIFKNLIENAVKFTQQGSVSVDVHYDDNQIVATVADEGIGIAGESLPNLFRRFYRTQTAVEHGIAGTGLGLYMVKEGVEKHGGVIEVASRLGKGTTFSFTLPLQNEEA